MVETAIPTMASSMIVFHVLATVCMSLRFYSKRISKTKYFLDDWVLIVAWVRKSLPPASTGIYEPGERLKLTCKRL